MQEHHLVLRKAVVEHMRKERKAPRAFTQSASYPYRVRVFNRVLRCVGAGWLSNALGPGELFIIRTVAFQDYEPFYDGDQTFSAYLDEIENTPAWGYRSTTLFGTLCARRLYSARLRTTSVAQGLASATHVRTFD